MNKMNDQDNFPYLFDASKCEECRGQCCRGASGNVWITIEEIETIAGAMDMNTGLFTKEYVRRVDGKFSLKERVVNGEHLCCFLDPIDFKCTVYEHRPEQCRTFPFWESSRDNIKELTAECPGVVLK